MFQTNTICLPDTFPAVLPFVRALNVECNLSVMSPFQRATSKADRMCPRTRSTAEADRPAYVEHLPGRLRTFQTRIYGINQISLLTELEVKQKKSIRTLR